MIRSVWTFPGQLTEYVGMGGGLLEGSLAYARRLEVASDLAGIDLSRVCREGPEATLRRHDCAALAVVAAGTAAAEELAASGYVPSGMLGYSLGLYTAAAASGAIDFETAFRIVLTIAGEGERCFPPGGMAMGFVTGLRLASIEEALKDPLDAGELAITNVNSQAQIVLAGPPDAVDRALDAVRPRAIRCERLPIDRPYHSPWMAPVARAVASLCESIEVQAPRIAFFDHRDGAPLRTAEEVRARLSGQLTTRLDWAAAIGRLCSEGAGVFVEMPPGNSTTRMVRWLARDATAIAIDQPADRERFLAESAGRREGGP